jgi:hypothetical protein
VEYEKIDNEGEETTVPHHDGEGPGRAAARGGGGEEGR